MDEPELQTLYESLFKTINNKLYNIGLKLGEWEINYNGYLTDISLELINTTDFIKYFKKYHDEYMEYIYQEIKKDQDYKDYGYDKEEFLKEEIENSLFNPFEKIRIGDISEFNQDIERDIIKKIENYIYKNTIYKDDKRFIKMHINS